MGEKSGEIASGRRAGESGSLARSGSLAPSRAPSVTGRGDPDAGRVRGAGPSPAPPPMPDAGGGRKGPGQTCLPRLSARSGSGASAPLRDGYYTHSSGLLIKHGTVIETRMWGETLDRECDRLDKASDRRGVQVWETAKKKPKRSIADELELRAIADWFNGEGLDIIGVVSFTPDYADRRYLNTLSRATDDVHDGLRSVPMKGGRIRGFPYKFVLFPEWHRTGRLVPHVHLALESGGHPGNVTQAICDDLWRYFFSTRGRSWFQPMRDLNKATLYGLKDAVKSSREAGDAVHLRLKRPRSRRSR